MQYNLHRELEKIDTELSFSHNTISLIVRVVSIALFEKFAFKVISCRTTAVEWQVIADMFATRWQFLHTQAGTLDGMHIAIRCPRNGGSLYYNYKVWQIYQAYYNIINICFPSLSPAHEVGAGDIVITKSSCSSIFRFRTKPLAGLL